MKTIENEAATDHPKYDEIVEAIRSHPIVGLGTCSPVDETFTDDELIREFGYVFDRPVSVPFGRPHRERRRSPKEAVAAAERYHEFVTAYADEVAATAF